MSLWLCLLGIAVILIALVVKSPSIVKNKKLLIVLGLVLIFWPIIWTLFGLLVAIIVAVILILIIIWLVKKVF